MWIAWRPDRRAGTALVLAAGLARLGFGAALAATEPPVQPGGPDLVLKVVVDEKGRNCNGSWEARYEGRYRLSAMWNGAVGGGVELGNRWALAGRGTSSPEGLYRLRGSILGLKEGEILQYYLSEMKASGQQREGAERQAMKATLERNGQYTVTVGEDTISQGDAAYRMDEGIPGNASFPGVGRSYGKDIQLQRTRVGVVITLDGGAWGLPHAQHTPAWPSSDLALAEGVSERVVEQASTFRLSNEELKNLRSVVKTGRGHHGLDDSDYSATVTLSFTPDEGDEVEVAVEPEKAYEAWLPSGRLEEPDRPGNDLLVRVDGHVRGDPAAPRRVKLRISLPTVSRNRGVCTNWPRKTAAVGEGLRFRREDFPADGPLVFVDTAHLESREAVERAEFLVHAHDYGAWGTVVVSARDERGRDAVVRVRGRDQAELSIPLDENRNHIADAWELAEVGDLRGREGDDAEDLPRGRPGCPGDGLSLYEEYRGFRVKGVHVRAEPRRKDVFVCDHTSGEVAQAGIDLFEKATGLKVWRMTYEELGSDRLVNRNGAGAGHAVDQHGILIEDGNGGTDPQQVPAFQTEAFGPPGMTLFVQLPTGGAYASGDGQSDVAHELCHAVGVRHHGDDNLYAVDWTWRLDAGGTWQLWEQAIEPAASGGWKPNGASPARVVQVFREPRASGDAPRPYRKEDGPPAGSATVGVDQYRLFVGGEQSPFSGDAECLLRYADKQAYLSKADPAHVRYLPDRAQWRPRTHLCSDRQGTGVNAPSHFPQSRYGPAPAGSCKAQIVISDKYATR